MRRAASRCARRSRRRRARIAAIDEAVVAAEDERDEAIKAQRELAQGSDPKFSAAIAGLGEALGREDLKDLLEEARLTRTAQDDTIIQQIDDARQRAAEEESETKDQKQRLKVLADRRRELEDIQFEFKKSRYDDPRSTFREDNLVGDLLTDFLRGGITRRRTTGTTGGKSQNWAGGISPGPGRPRSAAPTMTTPMIDERDDCSAAKRRRDGGFLWPDISFGGSTRVERSGGGFGGSWGGFPGTAGSQQPRGGGFAPAGGGFRRAADFSTGGGVQGRRCGFKTGGGFRVGAGQALPSPNGPRRAAALFRHRRERRFKRRVADQRLELSAARPAAPAAPRTASLPHRSPRSRQNSGESADRERGRAAADHLRVVLEGLDPGLVGRGEAEEIVGPVGLRRRQRAGDLVEIGARQHGGEGAIAEGEDHRRAVGHGLERQRHVEGDQHAADVVVGVVDRAEPSRLSSG